MKLDELRDVAAAANAPKSSGGGGFIIAAAIVVLAAAGGGLAAFLPTMVAAGGQGDMIAVSDDEDATRSGARNALAQLVPENGRIATMPATGSARDAELMAAAAAVDDRREARARGAIQTGGFDAAFARCETRYYAKRKSRMSRTRGGKKFDDAGRKMEAAIKASGFDIYPPHDAVRCIAKRHRADLCDPTFRSDFNKLVQRAYRAPYANGFRIATTDGRDRSTGMAKQYAAIGARVQQFSPGKKRARKKSTAQILRKLAREGRFLREEHRQLFFLEARWVKDLFEDGIEVRSQCEA